MKLSNPFPLEVRLLFVDVWKCWLCGSNGWTRGGLELHHILGRVSGSAFNAAPLCKVCHNGITHTRNEHQKLWAITIRFLRSIHYQPLDLDWQFLKDNWEELVSRETEQWLTT